MDTSRDLHMAIGWNRFNLKCVGIWPEPTLTQVRSGLSRYRFLISGFFIISFIWVPQIANLPLIWGNIDLVAENLATASIPALSAFAKLISAGYHKNDLRPLVRSFYEDWQQSMTATEQKIMMTNAKMGNRISIGCTILDLSMVTVFLITRILVLFGTDRDELPQDRIVLYPGYFPYNVRDNPIFELTILGQIIGAYCATLSYTGVDGFIAMMVLHTCAQFSNLRHRLENLVKTELMNPEEFQKELKWIAERHEHLNWFGNTIEESFNLVLLFQMVLCMIQICFQGFQTLRVYYLNANYTVEQIFTFFCNCQVVLMDFHALTANLITVFLQGKNENFVMQLIFLVLIVSVIGVHLYIYCYIGEMLRVQSAGIGDAAYNSKWYNVQAPPARNLLIVMNRSMRPVHLTAGKFSTFSFEMFNSVLKTSLGYLSVLLTVVNEGS